MRVFGGLLWLIALLCFMGAFGMDTSVSTGAGGRVHNIGLMRTQENAILLGIGLFIAGAIFLAIGGRRTAPVGDATLDAKDTKKCPFCAESIKKEAILCRFCSKEIPQVTAAPVAVSPVALGPLPGRCPNCHKIISFVAESCNHCKETFGPESAWKVDPL